MLQRKRTTGQIFFAWQSEGVVVTFRATPSLFRVELDDDERPNHQFVITRRARRHLSEYYAALRSSVMHHGGNNSRCAVDDRGAERGNVSNLVRSSVRSPRNKFFGNFAGRPTVRSSFVSARCSDSVPLWIITSWT